ncbi:MAG: hypothetical protein GF317_17090 [Candidatus Lokiarchaeota archaeon]|nr:hypothetical protein [Candidatus Lokiarchaeota archaeon]
MSKECELNKKWLKLYNFLRHNPEYHFNHLLSVSVMVHDMNKLEGYKFGIPNLELIKNSKDIYVDVKDWIKEPFTYISIKLDNLWTHLIDFVYICDTYSYLNLFNVYALVKAMQRYEFIRASREMCLYHKEKKEKK